MIFEVERNINTLKMCPGKGRILADNLVNMDRSHHGRLERYMLDQVGGLDERVEPSVGRGRSNVLRLTDG